MNDLAESTARIDEVVGWHQPSWNRLTDAAQQDRVPHAMLLAGRPGLGKYWLALSYVAWLHKHVQDPEVLPSNDDLRRLEASPNVRLVEPLEPGKPIVVDQIRALADFVYLTSAQGDYKAVIIRSADKMNRNACNSLLKTLEEPPPKTILILIADRPTQLPATVRSRCQTMHLLPPRRVGCDDTPPTAVESLMRKLAGGAPFAREALDTDETRTAVGEALRGFTAVITNDASPLAVAESTKNSEITTLLGALLQILHGIARRSIDPDASLGPDDRFMTDLTPAIDDIHLAKVLEAHSNVLHTLELAAGTSLRAQDLLENAWENIAAMQRYAKE